MPPETVSFKRCQHRTNPRSNSLRQGSAPPPKSRPLLVPVSLVISLGLIVFQRRPTLLIRCCKLLCFVNANAYLPTTQPLPGVGLISDFCRYTYRTLHIAVVCRLRYSNAFQRTGKPRKLSLPMGNPGPHLILCVCFFVFFFSSLSCEYVCVCFSRFYRLFLPYGQLSVLCSLSVQLIVNCYCL